jgi:hypothetical protein
MRDKRRKERRNEEVRLRRREGLMDIKRIQV